MFFVLPSSSSLGRGGGGGKKKKKKKKTKPKKKSNNCWFEELNTDELKQLCQACCCCESSPIKDDDLVARLRQDRFCSQFGGGNDRGGGGNRSLIRACNMMMMMKGTTRRRQKGNIVLSTENELKSMCRSRSLQDSGTKFDLVLRLVQHEKGTLKRAAAVQQPFVKERKPSSEPSPVLERSHPTDEGFTANNTNRPSSPVTAVTQRSNRSVIKVPSILADEEIGVVAMAREIRGSLYELIAVEAATTRGTELVVQQQASKGGRAAAASKITTEGAAATTNDNKQLSENNMVSDSDFGIAAMFRELGTAAAVYDVADAYNYILRGALVVQTRASICNNAVIEAGLALDDKIAQHLNEAVDFTTQIGMIREASSTAKLVPVKSITTTTARYDEQQHQQLQLQKGPPPNHPPALFDQECVTAAYHHHRPPLLTSPPSPFTSFVSSRAHHLNMN